LLEVTTYTTIGTFADTESEVDAHLGAYSWRIRGRFDLTGAEYGLHSKALDHHGAHESDNRNRFDRFIQSADAVLAEPQKQKVKIVDVGPGRAAGSGPPCSGRGCAARGSIVWSQGSIL
jgi:hypothetical protein